MKTQTISNRGKQLGFIAAVLLGLSLVIGATINLPASAQGLVTGRNAILIQQLDERVGTESLMRAVIDAGMVDNNQSPWLDNGRQPRNRSANLENGSGLAANQHNRGQRRRNEHGSQNGPRRGRGAAQLNEDIEDQLERLGPEIVYQIVVDAELLTQAEANRMLAQ